MAISNINFKAAGGGGQAQEAVPQNTQGAAPSVEQAIELKKKIEEILKLMEEAAGYDEYTTMGEKAEIIKNRALLESDRVILDYFLTTGEWDPPGTASANGQSFFDLNSVEGGVYITDPSKPYEANKAELDDSAAFDLQKLEAGEEYKGTINVDNLSLIDPTTGEVIPSNLWFIMTSSSDPSKDMQTITGRTVGNDVVVTITFGDGHKEAYVVKDAAIRNDIQIGVNALKSEHGVTMDFSHMVSIDPATGRKNGVLLIGSQYGDTMSGSDGADSMHGAGGSDTMDGMGNDSGTADRVYGYAGNTQSENVLGAYGETALGEDGDDQLYDSFATSATTEDYLNGGAGTDTVYGNRGMGTQTEGSVVSIAGDPDDIEDWFGANWEVESKDGELVVSGKAEDGSIEIEVPEGEGWMLKGEKDAKDPADLIITAVKPGNGTEPPVTQTIRIEGYFNEENAKLDITGDFVDLSGVDVGARSVKLTGYDSNGGILIGPKTVFDQYGIYADDLGSTNLDDATIEERLEDYKAMDENAGTVWQGAEYKDGEIVFDGIDELNIPADFGGVAFVQKDGSELVITVVGLNADGTAGERVVIRVKNAGDELVKNLTVNHYGMEAGKVFDLRDAENGDYGVLINGAGGIDLNAGYEFGATTDDDEDALVKIKAELEGEQSKPTVGKDEGDIISEIEACTDFAQLDAKYEQYKNAPADEDDEDAYESYLEAINDRRAELIDAKITEYSEDEELEKLESLNEEIAKLDGYDGDLFSQESLQTALDEAIKELEDKETA